MFPSKLITSHVDDQRKPNIFGNWICLINILDNVLFFVLRQIIIHTAIDFCQIIIFDIVVDSQLQVIYLIPIYTLTLSNSMMIHDENQGWLKIRSYHLRWWYGSCQNIYKYLRMKMDERVLQMNMIRSEYIHMDVIWYSCMWINANCVLIGGR